MARWPDGLICWLRLRFRSKPIAALSIVLVLVGALGGWHTPDDVDEYGWPASPRTAHEVRVAPPEQPDAPEHCALCHWLQALGKAAPPVAQIIAADSLQLIQAGALFADVRTADRLALPSRAPPLA